MTSKFKRPLKVRETFSVGKEVFQTRDEAERYIRNTQLQEQVHTILSSVIEETGGDYVALQKLSGGTASLKEVVELLCGWWPDFNRELVGALDAFYQQEAQ